MHMIIIINETNKANNTSLKKIKKKFYIKIYKDYSNIT